MQTLRENQRVSYDLEEDRRGKMAATNLRDASESSQPEAASDEQPAASEDEAGQPE
jgi:CspA family cold shock protein